MASKQSNAAMVLYSFIQEYQTEMGYSPSFDEILQNTSFKSKGHLHYLMNKLEALGLIERSYKKARGLQINKSMPVTVPLVGMIAAGIPLHLPESGAKNLSPVETLAVPGSILPRLPAESEIFALRVKGDSMIDAAVLDGDTVILARPKSLSQIKKNDMVAAWLVGEETTTLKHYVPQPDGSVWLVPANPDQTTYKPLVIRNPVEELEIHGIVVSIVRTYS